MNTGRQDVKFHQMSVTAQQWPFPNPLECFEIFSSCYWNYTRNYTRNYVSPAAIFKKPQVHDPETLSADKKLLGAAVLLTSHLPGTPSALEAFPAPHLHLSLCMMGRAHQQALTTRFHLPLSYSSNIPCCVDSFFSVLKAAGSRSQSLTEVYLPSFIMKAL